MKNLRINERNEVQRMGRIKTYPFAVDIKFDNGYTVSIMWPVGQYEVVVSDKDGNDITGEFYKCPDYKDPNLTMSEIMEILNKVHEKE